MILSILDESIDNTISIDLFNTIKDIANKCKDTNTTNLSIEDKIEKYSKSKYDSIRVYIGLNGKGKWSDYFSTLSKFTKIVEDTCNIDIYPFEVKLDNIDDVATIVFGINK